MNALLLFEGVLVPDYDTAELSRLWNQLYELATTKFGCIGHESYTGVNGSTFGIYRFATLEDLNTFGRDREHQEVQRRSREFFSTLHLTVVEVAREYDAVLRPPADHTHISKVLDPA